MIDLYILVFKMSILRDRVIGESFDYTVLMDCLSTYRSPRAKVTQLLKSGEIIRVKKGLYIFGPKDRRALVCLEALANKIYGPSYVSLEYALDFYGLIPEHVAEVTSVTTKRKKLFDTSVGRFSYTPIPVSHFITGFTLLQMTDAESACIATPEKAIADLFYTRKWNVTSHEEFEALLFEDLRLDLDRMKKLHIGVLEDILRAGANPLLLLLISWLKGAK